jgi:DNA modification methylase
MGDFMKSMMEPYHENSFVTLYNGDCMDAMASIGDSSVDIVITSPPYNTCKKGVLKESDSLKGRYHQRYDVFIESRTTDEYIEWSANLFREFDRILKENRVVLYNFGLGNDSQTDFGNADWFSTVCGICD